MCSEELATLPGCNCTCGNEEASGVGPEVGDGEIVEGVVKAIAKKDACVV